MLSLVKDTTMGTIRTGLWYGWAYTDRYQIPSNPCTWVDSTLPNFHERCETAETAGFRYQHKNWDRGFFNKHIGQMYNDYGKGSVVVNQGVAIQPFNLTNVFVNHTNNLLDNHNMVGITPALASGAANSPTSSRC